MSPCRYFKHCQRFLRDCWLSRHLEWSCFSLCSSATENKEHLDGKTIVLITHNKNTHQRDHMIAICSMENRWVALAIHSLVVSSVLMFFRCSGVKSIQKSWKCEHTSLWWHRLLKFQGKIIETTLISRLAIVDVTQNGSKLSTILPMRCLITRNMDITLSGGNTHLEPKHQKKKSTSWNETTTISYAYHFCSLTVPRNAQKKTEFKSACVFFNFCISANAKTIANYLAPCEGLSISIWVVLCHFDRNVIFMARLILGMIFLFQFRCQAHDLTVKKKYVINYGASLSFIERAKNRKFSVLVTEPFQQLQQPFLQHQCQRMSFQFFKVKRFSQFALCNHIEE